MKGRLKVTEGYKGTVVLKEEEKRGLGAKEWGVVDGGSEGRSKAKGLTGTQNLIQTSTTKRR